MELKAEKRDIFGKKLASFRKQGSLPAVLYGPKEETIPLFVFIKDFKKVWKEAGESSVIQLDFGDSKKDVLIQDVSINPKTEEPVHVDFYAAPMDELIEASVPLEFLGESAAVNDLGGILIKVLREIKIEALPKNLPHEVVVDISGLKNLGGKILAKDVVLPTGVTLKENPEETVVLVEAPKEEAEPAPGEEKISFEEIEVAGKKKKEEEAAERKE